LGVTLEDLYNGKTSKLSYRRNVVCATCKGLGASKKGSVKSCSECDGQGIRVTIRQMGMMIQQMQSLCPACGGQGEIIDKKDRCKDCTGHKVIQEKKILEVFIDKGMKHGQKITFAGEGDQSPELEPGDVIVVLVQTDHETFKRDGGNLIIEKDIPLFEALCGCSFKVKHLDGRLLNIGTKKGAVIKPGDLKVVPNEGMPTHKRPFDKGLLVIKFNIVFPDSVTPEQAAQLAQVLPKGSKKPEPAGAKDEEAEDVFLHDFNPDEYARNDHRRREAYDEDEERHEKVGCVPS